MQTTIALKMFFFVDNFSSKVDFQVDPCPHGNYHDSTSSPPKLEKLPGSRTGCLRALWRTTCLGLGHASNVFEQQQVEAGLLP